MWGRGLESMGEFEVSRRRGKTKKRERNLRMRIVEEEGERWAGLVGDALASEDVTRNDRKGSSRRR